jgi:2-oxoisovalerate dehydrogenase E1 component
MDFNDVREYIKSIKQPDNVTAFDLKPFGGLDKDALVRMFTSMITARRIEQEEKLLLRKGLCRFFIGCGGKELIDVVAAELLNDDDPFVGYYRNKAFDIHRGVSIRQKIMEAVGDVRSEATGGMLQPAHSSYPDKAILPQASPTGSHALEASGIGDAIKCPLPINGPIGIPGGRYKKEAVVYCAIGEGATSSPEFHRAVFYSVFNKTPNIFGIYNCGWAIATSVKEQFPEGNPTTSFEGYRRFDLMIENFSGVDIIESIKSFSKMMAYVRSGKGPAIANIKVSRQDSHSGSDDQAHYMNPKELKWHYDNDPIKTMAATLVDHNILSVKGILAIFKETDEEVRQVSVDVCSDIRYKKPEDVIGKVYSYNKETSEERWKKLVANGREKRIELYKKFHEKGLFETPELPENQPPMLMRKAINYSLFDLFILSDNAILFGEDVADFPREMFENNDDLINTLRGKGGVFLVTQNLQRAFGTDRVFNTPLDEAGIIGRAVGHAYQGRIPIPEIQFIDYMGPCYQQLKDRVATCYQRSNTRYSVPMVIRTTYGGYKQGAGAMWHSEANLGTFINIPGLHLAVPSNAADAAGLLRTAFVCGDPVLFCEAVVLYNRRDWEGHNIMAKYPDIDTLIPFGQAQVYNPQASDLAIISYGITLPISLRAADLLSEEGKNIRVIDLRTVKPIDWKTIETAVRDCSRVMIVSEDRFHGGVGPTIASYIAKNLFDYLDAPVDVLHAVDSRVAYGHDGDNICLPNTEKIVDAARTLLTH